jgi:hypothetical protein
VIATKTRLETAAIARTRMLFFTPHRCFVQFHNDGSTMNPQTINQPPSAGVGLDKPTNPFDQKKPALNQPMNTKNRFIPAIPERGNYESGILLE